MTQSTKFEVELKGVQLPSDQVQRIQNRLRQSMMQELAVTDLLPNNINFKTPKFPPGIYGLIIETGQIETGQDFAQGLESSRRVIDSILPLDRRADVSQTISEIQSLLSLDNVWTSHLKSVTSIRPQDLIAIRNITDRINTSLIQTEQLATRMNTLFKQYPQQLEEGYKLLLTNSQLPLDRRDWIRRYVDRRGGIVQSSLTATQRVVEMAPNERLQIRQKMQILENGEFTQGDITREFCCEVAGIAIATAPFEVGAGGLVGLFAVSVAVGFAISAGC